MTKIYWSLLLLFSWGAMIIWGSCQRSIQIPSAERELIWEDEFDVDSIPNSEKWAYETGGWGWGNNELQYYTANRTDNARIENSRLIIEAKKETYENRGYTSARLVTRGKQTWQYGLIEVKAKLPKGRGTWPAIWMLGANIKEVGWPRCGEIDIMEHVGFEPDSIWGTIHCEAYNHLSGTEIGKGIEVTDVEDEFHVYAIDWKKEQIDFLFDGQIYHTVPKPENVTKEEWPFDSPHYLLLNIAVGGNWGGRHGVDTTIWPQRMEIDWVRVWQ